MKYWLGVILLSCYTALSCAETLTILNWEEYLSEQVIADWEKKTGHRIKQIYYDNDEERDAILASRTSAIDLAVTDEVSTPLFGKRGILLPITSYVNTANISSIDKEWQGRCGEHGVAYLWGTIGVAYRTDKLAVQPTSWDILFNPPADLSGHVGLIEDYIDLLAPALFLRQKSINTESQQELKAVFDMLKVALPHALTMDYGISFLEVSPQKDQLFITLAYSGDQYALNEKIGAEVWEYTTLNEGTAAWVDCLAVLAGAKNRALAYDFINYLYTPEVAAVNSEDVAVAVPIEAARSYQSKAFLSDKSVYPPKEIMDKAQYYHVLSPDNVVLRNRITQSLVKIYESQ